uniref:COX2_CUA domain-containing protein n=1 Tax=Rodentolepis nana TaxID=102285 RepID=A0A0R3T814_RODNA
LGTHRPSPSIVVEFAIYLQMKKGGRIMYDSEKQIVELVSETIKIVGHQWYWEYDTSQGSFESFVQCDKFIVDKPLRLIRGLPYHFIVTSADVTIK